MNRSIILKSWMAILFFMPLSIYAQKSNQGKTLDIIVKACVQPIGNGMYQVTFSYDNPNKTEITLTTDKSYLKKNGKMSGNGVTNFKRGYIIKAFTTQFYKTESVEWSVVNPNGKIHIVAVNASSPECQTAETSIIVPVYGQGDGKDETKLGLELTALAGGNAGDDPSKVIYFFNPTDKNEVLIEIIPKAGQLSAVLGLLTNTFGRQYNANLIDSDFLLNPSDIVLNELTTIDVYFPINRLLELINVADINFVRPLYPSYTNSGIVTSKGDKAQKSEAAREAFRVKDASGALVKVNGNGIKVGVISDSYDKQPFTGKSKATVDVEQGDLPGTSNPEGNNSAVEVLLDYPYGVASDEGRAMLQIVHDVAPGAKLAFHTGVLSPRNFELAIESLQAADCDIIVDDITFPLEPFFGTGRISAAIKNFTTEQGNLYFTSAGNFANNGYQAAFSNSSSTPGTNFLPAGSRAHVFGTPGGVQDVLQKISVEPGVYMIVLQWDEFLASQQNSTGAITDLDIFLVDDNGRLIVGNNRINQAGDPTEVIVFEAKASGTANIMVASASGAAPAGLAFRYITFRSQGLNVLEYAGAPTVSGHAMTPEANTIAAIDYRVALNPSPQYFSSYAGNLADNSVLEIDLAAPDGGNTNVGSIGNDIEGEELINGTEDKFLNFFGTSAAAPHAAGAFALMMSAIPNWYPNGLPGDIVLKTNAAADEALKLVKQTATPAGTLERSGAGLINLEAAFTAIAAKTAKVTKLIVEDGKTPSAEPFSVTIIGEYFPTDPKIIFDGKELEITSKTDTEIVAIVGTFTGNPALQVQTNSLPGSINNGGLSDPVYFFEDGKIALNIVADNVTLEYGQAVNFTFKVEGLGDKTYESTGLPEVKFTTPAVFPYPDVNNYTVTPVFEVALADEQKAKYQINFIKAIFEVTKKELTIKPDDLALNYGEPVEVTLNYSYDVAGITNNADFLLKIENAHIADFYEENTLVLINKFQAVVNAEILGLLQNGSWMTSSNIQNKLMAVVNGMNVINLDILHFQNYFSNKLQAVVNAETKLRAVVNGEDLMLNKLQAVVNAETKLRAVVNGTGLGGTNDTNDYGSIFGIIDEKDTEENGVTKLYANHLITGLTATNTTNDRHYIFPGAFLSPLASNFKVKYGSGRLAISKAELRATIQDLVINKGEAINPDLIAAAIEGYVYGETQEMVFPDGIAYRFINDQGQAYVPGATGVFNITIIEPGNYMIKYNRIGKIYVNSISGNSRNVRTYLDCIEVKQNSTNGLNYIANFRYNNPNSEVIYVLHGADNRLFGEANYLGETPIIFLPGENTFKIEFDGRKLIWSLTTYNSTQKSSVSSEATSDSGKCEAKGVDTTAQTNYLVGPNPTDGNLTITRNIAESGILDVFTNYGVLVESKNFSKSNTDDILLNLSGPSGLYYLRITAEGKIYMFNIIKN